jgi:hypothetical protein
MMGWLALSLLVVASTGVLWLLKVRGGLLTAALAALIFGAAGYAFQGSPGVPDAPASAAAMRNYVPLTAARHAFFGNFSAEEAWVSMSEGLERGGDTESAVGLLQNAVRRYPGSAHLWIALGNALVDHATASPHRQSSPSSARPSFLPAIRPRHSSTASPWRAQATARARSRSGSGSSPTARRMRAGAR